MTIREALLSVLDGITVSTTTIDKVLLDAGITGTTTYTSLLIETVDLAAIEVLKLGLLVKSISEGGYSITYDTEGLLERLRLLSAKYNLPVPSVGQPKIRAVNYW